MISSASTLFIATMVFSAVSSIGAPIRMPEALVARAEPVQARSFVFKREDSFGGSFEPRAAAAIPTAVEPAEIDNSNRQFPRRHLHQFFNREPKTTITETTIVIKNGGQGKPEDVVKITHKTQVIEEPSATPTSEPATDAAQPTPSTDGAQPTTTGDASQTTPTDASTDSQPTPTQPTSGDATSIGDQPTPTPTDANASPVAPQPTETAQTPAPTPTSTDAAGPAVTPTCTPTTTPGTESGEPSSSTSTESAPCPSPTSTDTPVVPSPTPPASDDSGKTGTGDDGNTTGTPQRRSDSSDTPLVARQIAYSGALWASAFRRSLNS